jgi:circadian clock protein KaiB
MDASDQRYLLRLYVSGTTARSVRAIASMKQICETHLHGRYDLDVVDVYQNPTTVRDDDVVAVPTLVKLLPEPLRRLIGDLSVREKVLAALSIVPKTEPPP